MAAAIAIANDIEYGLAAGIFTSDVAATVQAMRQIDAGNIHLELDAVVAGRSDALRRAEGQRIGKEGIRSAVTK